MNVSIISPYRAHDAPTMAAGDSALNAYTAMLGRALADRGTEVTVFAPGSGRASLAWNDGAVRVISCFERADARSLRRLQAAVSVDGARVVHVQQELFAYGGIAGAFLLPGVIRALRASGRRVLTTIHGVIPLDAVDRGFVRGNGIKATPGVARAAWRHLLRKVARASDVVHVHEARLADLLRSQYGLRDLPILTIPHGLDPSPETGSRSATRARLGLEDDARVVLFFGFLAQYKGLDRLIREAPQMLTADPTLRIVIAGGAPKRLGEAAAGTAAALARLAGTYPTRVLALGFVPDDDVPGLLAAADVMLMPYTVNMAASGPFGLAVSHRLPLLLSDAFAHDYPGYAGVFSAAPGSLAEKVARFFDSPRLRADAETFLRTQRTRMAWPEVAAQFERAYAEIECAR